MTPPSLADLPAPPPGRSGWPWTEESPPAPEAVASLPIAPIAIVTPSLNQARFIEETIRSVLLQGYPALDYVVVDGGSTDGTLEILRRYEPWLRWVSEPDRGQAEAINKGLRTTTGDLQAYLNSDDAYLPGALHSVAAFAAAHPGAGLIYGECRVVDETGEAIGDLPRRPFVLRRTIERAEFLPQPAVFWRAAAARAAGPFDESLHYAMDYDYFLRIAKSFPVARLQRPLASFRMHDSSKTVSRSEEHWREALAVSERHGLTPGNPWYWLRRIRHHGLNAVPGPLQLRIRQGLGRPHDPKRPRGTPAR